MKKRNSIVHSLHVKSIAFSSILEIGDSYQLQPSSKVLAVQRGKEIYFENEGSFQYPVFQQSLPQPTLEKEISFHRINESPHILVDTISVAAISTSSIMQIGSSDIVKGEAKVKHIRQIIDDTHKKC